MSFNGKKCSFGFAARKVEKSHFFILYLIQFFVYHLCVTFLSLVNQTQIINQAEKSAALLACRLSPIFLLI
jgi:hypothetical protein